MAANKKKMFQKDLIATKHIPLDVIETILSKLPIKDVLRFKAVSKSWHATVLNPTFARLHLNNTYYNSNNEDDNHLFMWPSRDTGIYHLGKFNGSQFQVISHLQCPVQKPRPAPLCSCDGFFLIYDTASKVCVLWNPISQSKTSFPYPETMNSPLQTTHGICYDSSEDDYKVVFVNWKFMIYTVFSCINNSWSKMKQFPYSKIEKDSGISVGGVPYWIVSDTNTNFIVYFDAKDGGFNKFLKPNDVTKTDSIRLTNLNGRLCFYQMPNDNAPFRIWVQTPENAWTTFNASRPLPWKITKTLLLLKDGSTHALYITVRKSIFVLIDEYKASGSVGRTMTNKMASEVAVVRGSLRVLPPRKTGIGGEGKREIPSSIREEEAC